jgi:hypothetical protein
VIFGDENAIDSPFPVQDGRRPAQPGEALIGADTAEALDLAIGDQVTAQSNDFGELHITVVGIGVLPSLGPFVADHTGLGAGVFVILDDEVTATSSPAFTGIRLRSGADPDGVLATLEPDLPTWSVAYETPVSHAEPVRPPEIENVSELQQAPRILGGTLLAALTLSLWLAITLSVRDRRRELAVLRAIGFAGGDVRRSVWWQGLTLVGVGVAIGIPLGVVGGRAAWQYFADRLGVVPDTTVPLGWLALLVLVTVVLGWIAVALPARAAARVSPARELLAT